MPYRVVNTELIADGAITAAKMADHILPQRIFEAEPDGMTQSMGVVALDPRYDPEGLYDSENDWIDIPRAGLYLITATFHSESGGSPKEICIKEEPGYGAHWSFANPIGQVHRHGTSDGHAMTATALAYLTGDNPVYIIITSNMSLVWTFLNRVIIAQLAQENPDA